MYSILDIHPSFMDIFLLIYATLLNSNKQYDEYQQVR